MAIQTVNRGVLLQLHVASVQEKYGLHRFYHKGKVWSLNRYCPLSLSLSLSLSPHSTVEENHPLTGTTTDYKDKAFSICICERSKTFKTNEQQKWGNCTYTIVNVQLDL